MDRLGEDHDNSAAHPETAGLRGETDGGYTKSLDTDHRSRIQRGHGLSIPVCRVGDVVVVAVEVHFDDWFN